MKKYLLMALLAVGVVGIAGAAPTSSFTATVPTQYEDGTMIPISDVLTYRLYCSASQGGPYNVFYDVVDITSFSTDVATCVQGVPGTYYFVATSRSTTYGTESDFSNETSRSYTAAELGKVPNAPTLLQVQ